MNNNRYGWRRQRGQSTLVVLLALGIFLLGFIALAVDFSNLWFHRQTAQSAADAACIAAAADMLVKASGGTTTLDGKINAGTPFLCSANMSTAPCQYALLNGYDATAGLVNNTESRDVNVWFPTSLPGVVTDPKTTAIAGANVYVRADLTDRSRVFFSSLFTQRLTQDVVASAACGLLLAKAPIPLIVLHPTCAHSFEVGGSASLTIVGGPTRSVQVNSSNTTCAAATTDSGCNGNGTIDLSQGGPDFTGSNFGTFGAPAAAPNNFSPGSTGAWQHGTPIADPYSQAPVPSTSGLPVDPAVVAAPYGTDGCPDHSNCVKYIPGVYNKPIVVKGETAIFMPGVYIIQPSAYNGQDASGTHSGDASGGGLCGNPSSCSVKPSGQCHAAFLVEGGGVIRPGIPSGGTGKEGAMFYLSGTAGDGYASAVFTSNAGSPPGTHTVDKFDTTRMICPGGTSPSSKVGIPDFVDGNVLMGECTANGTYIANGGAGKARGLIIFQNHANGDEKGQANMQGGGGLLIAGTIYAHNDPDYKAFVQLQGNPGSGTYLFGEIVTDQFELSGNGAIAMQLSPDAVLDVLKVQLLQ